MQYSLVGYAAMLSDERRLAAYAEALKRHVHGRTVLDLGAGFGFFSLLALRLGAKRVHAIEPADSAALLPALAAANGFEGRFVLYRSLSSEVTLPERVGLVVADVRGSIPTYARSLQTIIDARQRFLAPDGQLLPKRDVLMLAPVEDAEKYARLRGPWSAGGQSLRLEKVESLLVNNLIAAKVRSETLLANPASWAVIDYRTMVSPNVAGKAVFETDRAATLHGFALWFDAEIDDGLTYSSAPGTEQSAYGQNFLPLAQPVELAKGDTIDVALQAHCLTDYVYRWQTRVTRNGVTVAAFSQSTFEGIPLDLAKLRKGAEKYKPSLDERGHAERFVLGEFTGQQTLRDIADRLLARHPTVVPTAEDAFNFVAELSAKSAALLIAPMESKLTEGRAAAAAGALLLRTALSPEETASRVKRARDALYWRDLLHGIDAATLGDPVSWEARQPGHAEVSDARGSVTLDGYFQLAPVLRSSVTRALGQAMCTVVDAGWPALFVLAHETLWRLTKVPSLDRILEAVLGSGYKPLRYVACQYVLPVQGARGWAPHMDWAPRTDAPPFDGRFTVWIPLSDATLDNSCIHVVPHSQITTSLRGRYHSRDAFTRDEVGHLLQAARALPAAAGSLLGWSFDVLHWGATSRGVGGARMSLAAEFVAANAYHSADELVHYDPVLGAPPLEERLDAIAHALVSYARFEPAYARYADLARAISRSEIREDPVSR